MYTHSLFILIIIIIIIINTVLQARMIILPQQIAHTSLAVAVRVDDSRVQLALQQFGLEGKAFGVVARKDPLAHLVVECVLRNMQGSSKRAFLNVTPNNLGENVKVQHVAV